MINKTLAIIFNQYGSPEVLRAETHLLPELKSDEVRILHKAIGVNFIDSYYRTGLYQTSLPSGLGTEAAGVVEAVGEAVGHLKIGDRVAYVQGPLGAYAERRNLAAKFVVKIPENVSFTQAASVMLKGLTVRYLFQDIHQLKKNEMVLFHAAAGGVGLIACQWARSLGAKLIGTTSSDEKAQIAKDQGAWEVINYKKEDVAEKVFELTHGLKVPVVYDGVGKSTWQSSLECLQTKGLMVSFGNASGPVTGVNLSELQRGSFFVTRPILGHYLDSEMTLQKAAQELFRLVAQGFINVDQVKTYALEDAREAHLHLTNRDRLGGMILLI
jgi:NADPH:quinone reductase